MARSRPRPPPPGVDTLSGTGQPGLLLPLRGLTSPSAPPEGEIAPFSNITTGPVLCWLKYISFSVTLITELKRGQRYLKLPGVGVEELLTVGQQLPGFGSERRWNSLPAP